MLAGAYIILHAVFMSSQTQLKTLFEITARRGHLMFHVFFVPYLLAGFVLYFLPAYSRRFSFHDGPESLRLTTG